ncbi:hypothetical protein PNH50_06155 [Leisingera aquaemixtae]|uniref:hypothetical protein n=1 Tax=Leisingera aquaemixtae TaxID=1396826 RepID=UPI003983E162
MASFLRLILSFFLMSCPALAFDAFRGLPDPVKIFKNGERELRKIHSGVDSLTWKVFRDIDKGRLEFMVQQGAPILEKWLKQSRNSAQSGALPIPEEVFEQLRFSFDESLLRGVRYKIGDPGVVNIANLSIAYGGASAVTLIDVIVFRTEDDLKDIKLWYHELVHAEQFSEWGVKKFAIRYLRSWNSVEAAAYGRADKFFNNESIVLEMGMTNSARSVNSGGWTSGTSFDVSNDHIFWAADDGNLYRANIRDELIVAEQVDSGGFEVANIQVDEGFLYWVLGDGNIYRASISSGQSLVAQQLDSGGWGEGDFAVDGGIIYWITGDDLFKSKLDTPLNAITVSSGGWRERSEISVSKNRIIWTENGNLFQGKLIGDLDPEVLNRGGWGESVRITFVGNEIFWSSRGDLYSGILTFK